MIQTAAREATAVGEREARVDLAAAHRLAVMDQLHEGSWNHFSVAVPGAPEQMLITPPETHWSLVSATNLVLAGRDPEPLRGAGPALWVAYCIHYPIHLARPDAPAVLHAHPPHCAALTMIEDFELKMAHQHAISFFDRVAYSSDWDLGVSSLEEGAELAKLLGDKHVLFLRGHGVIVLGETIAEAYSDLQLLELACRNQLLATSSGSQLVIRPDDELRPRNKAAAAEHRRRHFATMKNVLDRDQPEYRD